MTRLDPAIHKSLLLGTGHAPLSLAALPASLKEQVAPLLEHGEQASALWLAIAATDIYQRAGYQAASLPQMAGAEPDERRCPAAIEHSLNLLMRGLYPELLIPWLRLAQGHGLRLPHTHLPALLDMGMQKPALRAALKPLLDKRGQWLLAQHPDWARLYGTAGEDVQEQWAHGNLAERTQALHAMRRADPAGALAALQSDWRNEPPENRAALLPCLATGLSLDDDAFLEAALDDKRKEVRTAAQQLLAALPGSQLMQRCQQRLQTSLFFEKQFLLGPKLSVKLPEACDKAMQRDGIGQRPAPGLGEKATLLRDLMQCVAPEHWSRQWELAPIDVIKLLAKHEFKQALLEGLAQAAVNTFQYRQVGDASAWYEAILDALVIGKLGIVTPCNLMDSFSLLTVDTQQAMILHWLEASDKDEATQRRVMGRCSQAANAASEIWPLKLSRLLLEHMQHLIKINPEPISLLGYFLDDIALVLNVSEPTYFENNWPTEAWEHWPQWRKPIDTFLETLRFRHMMQKSFLETTA
jgi:hypothetical protein